MITFGKGGWTWDDLYNKIPIFLREFYIKEMNEVMKQEREAIENAKKKITPRLGNRP